MADVEAKPTGMTGAPVPEKREAVQEEMTDVYDNQFANSLKVLGLRKALPVHETLAMDAIKYIYGYSARGAVKELFEKEGERVDKLIREKLSEAAPLKGDEKKYFNAVGQLVDDVQRKGELGFHGIISVIYYLNKHKDKAALPPDEIERYAYAFFITDTCRELAVTMDELKNLLPGPLDDALKLPKDWEMKSELRLTQIFDERYMGKATRFGKADSKNVMQSEVVKSFQSVYRAGVSGGWPEKLRQFVMQYITGQESAKYKITQIYLKEGKEFVDALTKIKAKEKGKGIWNEVAEQVMELKAAGKLTTLGAFGTTKLLTTSKDELDKALGGGVSIASVLGLGKKDEVPTIDKLSVPQRFVIGQAILNVVLDTGILCIKLPTILSKVINDTFELEKYKLSGKAWATKISARKMIRGAR